ncbi:unnamed protein product [Somion occarium]|uniref:Uncharacterized protein n=1 Tax=Somion occarium TaxID=3059160 RepID=A0ABP1DB62_9APHY
MSDRQKVLVILALLSETCTANITPLEQAPSSSSSSSPHSLTVLRKDFLSLLTLVYTSSTKVALTLRPSEPAYTAALTPIRDLATHISSLTTCATLFDAHGITLAKEVRRSAQDVCEAARALSQTFVTITENADRGSSSSGGGSEDYLIRTGAIHELVEKIKGSLPDDNIAAVRKRYSVDVDMLEDSLKEVAEMIEDAGGDDEGFEDEDIDDFDDAFDELGLGSTKKLSTVEVERIKKIQPLLRMSALLHKRIMLDLLKKGQTYSSEFSRRADSLLDMSNTLLLAHEEIVAVLYAPQKLPAISESLAELVTAVKRVQDTLLNQELLPPPRPVDGVASLEQTLAAVSISKSETPKKERDVRKWFDTCFEQMFKLSKTLHDGVAFEPDTVST